MKLAAILAVVSVVFAVAAVGLYRTVGGLVEQAGTREEHAVTLDVAFALADRDGAPIADAPVRVVLGANPQQQTPSAGQRVTTDAGGHAAFTTTAVLDKAQKKRPTSFISSLFAKPELTDHLGVGVELSYLTYRWLYVAHLYRFPNADVLHDGISLFTRADSGSFSVPAEQDSGGWKIRDLGPMRMTTLGYDFTLNAFDQVDPEHWKLSIAFTRQPAPIAR